MENINFVYQGRNSASVQDLEKRLKKFTHHYNIHGSGEILVRGATVSEFGDYEGRIFTILEPIDSDGKINLITLKLDVPLKGIKTRTIGASPNAIFMELSNYLYSIKYQSPEE